MKLSNLFNFERTTFKTTTTLIGTVNHTRIGERPWDNNDYRWSTHNHPVRFEMRQNEFGSYDVAQRMQSGAFSWSWQPQATNIPKQEAINMLIAREVQVMHDFGGFKKGVTVGDVQKQVKEGDYGAGHIFGYLRKNPAALEAWAATIKPAAQKPAAPPPAPSTP